MSVSDANRARIRRVIGERAEQLVYVNCVMDILNGMKLTGMKLNRIKLNGIKLNAVYYRVVDSVGNSLTTI